MDKNKKLKRMALLETLIINNKLLIESYQEEYAELEKETKIVL